LTDYIVPGQANNPADISKLQFFLSTYEHDSAVTVNGVLDQATLNGIISFQNTYLSNIMGPWGVTTPSGNIYMTSLKQINNIVCGTSLSLTASELADINAYKASFAANASGTNGISGSSAETVSGTGSTTTGTTGTPNNSLLTGNVVSSGAGIFFSNLFSKIWNFFSGK
jgi:hypothetical protein